jgi:hypothetical protein
MIMRNYYMWALVQVLAGYFIGICFGVYIGAVLLAEPCAFENSYYMGVHNDKMP